MRRFTIALGSLFLVIALSAAVSTAAQKHATESAASPQVVLDWNATAVATTIAAGKSQPESGLYVGLTQAAIYDAVIAIDGGLHPYLIVPGVPPGSSDEAAAAAAAYGVLVGYFPAQKPALDAAYATSLAGIPDGTAKDRGVLVGQQVAAGLIAARIDDGRNASVPLAPTPGPGVWQPTPPAFLPALHPWLGAMKPLLLASASQFRPATRTGTTRRGPTRPGCRSGRHPTIRNTRQRTPAWRVRSARRCRRSPATTTSISRSPAP